MAYNEKLAGRIREALSELSDVEEKKMFTGVTFMVNGKMCICVAGNELMCRIDPELTETLLEKPACRPMIHTGRTLKGYVYVNESGFKTGSDFEFWIKLVLDFNGKARASKKRKRKVK